MRTDSPLTPTGRVLATFAFGLVGLMVLTLGAFVMVSVGWTEDGAAGHQVELAAIGCVAALVVIRCGIAVWRAWHPR